MIANGAFRHLSLGKCSLLVLLALGVTGEAKAQSYPSNTIRIVGRVRMRTEGQRWQTRLDLYELAGRPGADADFNYALLDLGALICRPTAPRCGECPVADLCGYAHSRMTKASNS